MHLQNVGYNYFGNFKQTKKESFGSKKSFENLLKYQANHKNNPKEHETDKLLGFEIEEANANIIRINNEIKKTNNSEKLSELKKELDIYETQKSKSVNTLTSRHLKFALLIANKYRHLATSIEDLISSASLGIFEAAQRYSPSKYPDVHFVTYAKFWGRQRILRDIANDSQIRIPIGAKALKDKILNAKKVLEENLKRTPTDKEIATYLGITEARVKDIKLNANFSSISLDAHILGEENENMLANVIPDEKSGAELELKMHNEDLNYLNNLIQAYLNPREQHILRRRYRLGESNAESNLVTYDILSKELNLTKERIRQIEVNAINKLIKIHSEAYKENDFQTIMQMFEITKQRLSPQENNLKEYVHLKKFLARLTMDENEKNKNLIQQKINSYNHNEFIQMIKNTTSEKSAEVILLKYLKTNSKSITEICEILGIARNSLFYREREGLEAIKKYLIEGNNIGFSFLKLVLSTDLRAHSSTKALIGRIEKISNSDLYNIMQSKLSPIELVLIKEKYGIGKELKYGFKPKTNEELAKMVNMKTTQVHYHTCKALRKLKMYFSKSTINNTNLAFFANDITRNIVNSDIRNQAIKQIKELNAEDLGNFLQNLLNEKEILYVKKRYNLDSSSNPRLPLVFKEDIIKLIPSIGTMYKVRILERNIFNKIKIYFENNTNNGKQ